MPKPGPSLWQACRGYKNLPPIATACGVCVVSCACVRAWGITWTYIPSILYSQLARQFSLELDTHGALLADKALFAAEEWVSVPLKLRTAAATAPLAPCSCRCCVVDRVIDHLCWSQSELGPPFPLPSTFLFHSLTKHHFLSSIPTSTYSSRRCHIRAAPSLWVLPQRS